MIKVDNNLTEAHGGNVYQASNIYGIKKENILDYSANINPLGIPPGLREVLMRGIDELVNYPDIQCAELRAAISEYLKVNIDNIIAGNGASEVIFLLMEVLKPKKLMIAAPTFLEYEKAARKAQVDVEYFRLREQEKFRLDVERLLSEARKSCDAIIFCNPNNPTSTLAVRKEIEWLVKAAQDSGIYVIIDEAFIELTDGGNKNSAVGLTACFDNLFIIRAFTKLFAVPGLRLGYGLGDGRLVKAMWDKKLTWSVNSLACSMGSFLNSSAQYLQDTQLWIKAELSWFYGELLNFKGMKVFEPHTNFILAKITDGTWNAGKLKHVLAGNGVLIRNAENFMFLDDSFFRMAIKDRTSNIRFLQILKKVLE